MPSPKLSPAEIEWVDRITRRYAVFAEARGAVETEVRLEIQKRMEAQEALIAAEVLSAMRETEIPKTVLAKAIGKQNRDRWKAWLARWEPAIPAEMTAVASAEAPDPVIEYELTHEQILQYDKLATEVDRYFKMREWTYPHKSHIRASRPGTDTIAYRTDRKIATPANDRGIGFNPAWANGDSMPLGEHEAEILAAIKAWIEKHPEAPE